MVFSVFQNSLRRKLLNFVGMGITRGVIMWTLFLLRIRASPPPPLWQRSWGSQVQPLALLRRKIHGTQMSHSLRGKSYAKGHVPGGVDATPSPRSVCATRSGKSEGGRKRRRGIP